jgi:hypothetical protein
MNCMPPEYGNLVEIRPIGSFKQPLSVTWADGVTSSYVYRDVTNSPQQATTYTIASMHDAYCEAILEAPLSITVYASPAPVFQEPSVGEMCNGQIGTIALAVPPPPEADSQVTWQIDNGLPVVVGESADPRRRDRRPHVYHRLERAILDCLQLPE